MKGSLADCFNTAFVSLTDAISGKNPGVRTLSWVIQVGLIQSEGSLEERGRRGPRKDDYGTRERCEDGGRGHKPMNAGSL